MASTWIIFDETKEVAYLIHFYTNSHTHLHADAHIYPASNSHAYLHAHSLVFLRPPCYQGGMNLRK